MTPLAAHLAGRQLTTAVPDTRRSGQVTSLSHLRPTESGRIVGYAPGMPAAHGRRLFDLGFAPGVDVEAVRRAPALDPWIYRISGNEIALRRVLADRIVVERS